MIKSTQDDVCQDTQSSFLLTVEPENKERRRSFCQIGIRKGDWRRQSFAVTRGYSRQHSKQSNNNSKEFIFYAYAEYVIDYLRSCGIRAKLVLHIMAKHCENKATTTQLFVSSDGSASRFTYHGEAIFYGVLRQSTWQFGLKDVGLATVANLINYTTNNNDKEEISER